MKEVLSKEPILKLPDLDKEFILQTHASDVGIGACLLQQHEGVKHSVLYASKKLLGRERNYPVGEREALSIVMALSTTFMQFAPETTKFRKITLNNGHFAVQDHSRSLILVPIESSYTTSY